MNKEKIMWLSKAAGGLVVGFLLAHFLCGCSSAHGPALARDAFGGELPLEHGALRGNLDAGGQRILGGSDFGLVVPPLAVPRIGPVLSAEQSSVKECSGSIIEIIWDVLRADVYGGFIPTGPDAECSYQVPAALDGATLRSDFSLACWWPVESPSEDPSYAKIEFRRAAVGNDGDDETLQTFSADLPKSGAKVLLSGVKSFQVQEGDILYFNRVLDARPKGDFFYGGTGGGFWRLTVVSLGE
jgi:hypothetical protein